MSRGRKIRVRRNPKETNWGQVAIGGAVIAGVAVGGYAIYSVYKGVSDVGKGFKDLVGGAGDFLNKGFKSLADGAAWVGKGISSIPGGAWEAIKSVNPWAYKAPAPPPPPVIETRTVASRAFQTHIIKDGKIVDQNDFSTQALAQKYIDLNQNNWPGGTWQIIDSATGQRIVGGVISAGSKPTSTTIIETEVARHYDAQIIHSGKMVGHQESDDLDSAHKYITANIGNKAWKPGTWQIVDTTTGGRVDAGTFKGFDTPYGRMVLGQYQQINGAILSLENSSELARTNRNYYDALYNFHRAAEENMKAQEIIERLDR